MGTTTTLVYTGDPCRDCDMETLFYGSCSLALSQACAARRAPPPYQPPPASTPGLVPGSPPAPTVLPTGVSCGSCRKPAATATATGAPAGPATVAAPAAKAAPYPWWVIVLAVLVLAQIVAGGQNGQR